VIGSIIFEVRQTLRTFRSPLTHLAFLGRSAVTKPRAVLNLVHT